MTAGEHDEETKELQQQTKRVQWKMTDHIRHSCDSMSMLTSTLGSQSKTRRCGLRMAILLIRVGSTVNQGTDDAIEATEERPAVLHTCLRQPTSAPEVGKSYAHDCLPFVAFIHLLQMPSMVRTYSCQFLTSPILQRSINSVTTQTQSTEVYKFT